jgi:hypothetical protein
LLACVHGVLDDAVRGQGRLSRYFDWEESTALHIYELDVSWITTPNEWRYLHWELLAHDDVHGVFLTARDDTLAVLFSGDRQQFRDWARGLEPAATR